MPVRFNSDRQTQTAEVARLGPRSHMEASLEWASPALLGALQGGLGFSMHQSGQGAVLVVWTNIFGMNLHIKPHHRKVWEDPNSY